MMFRELGLALAVLVPVCACSTPPRRALPEELSHEALPMGIPGVRFWGDVMSPELLAAAEESAARERAHVTEQGVELPPLASFLAISGGGANGAFGAGLLNGWTEAGDRPQFKLVTGISTGALIAPFAFVGPECDEILHHFYTTTKTEDVIHVEGVWDVLFGEAGADSSPLTKMIASLVDEDLLARVAEEHAKGRMLFVSTSHIDAGRPVIWDMGRIAASGAPRALELFRAVMLASASIPGAFPPVMIPVEAGGEEYDEMHVDGGVSAQVFLYPEALELGELAKEHRMVRLRRAFVIRNSRIAPEWKSAERRTFSIMARSISQLIRTQGIGDLYRIYTETKRDGIEYRLAYIPDDFDVEPKEEFDPVYMTELYAVGEKLAREGYPWLELPPGFETVPPPPAE